MFLIFLGLAVADLVFLAVWFVQGQGVDGDPLRAQRHQVGGLLVAILTCFVHAVTFVYFLGTGLAVKEARRNWGIDAAYVRRTRRFKLEVYPIAMVAIASIVTASVLGGAVRAGALARAWHPWTALAATIVSALAFVVALRGILRNGWMLGLIRGDIAEIRSQAAHGEVVELPETGAPPELLKRPEDVKRPPKGFLAARALLFLGASVWLLLAYLEWWLDVEHVPWSAFAATGLGLIAGGIYLRIRHPLPADVDF